MKKIKIKVNGKFKTVLNNSKLSDLLKNLNIPIKKVAIELNQEIIDKKRSSNIKLKKDDKIATLKVVYNDEIVGEFDLLASNNVKKVNLFSRLLKSLNYLIWGDV